MSHADFRYLSKRNDSYSTHLVTVANGATFVALTMPPGAFDTTSNGLYLHVHSTSRQCYVGVTVQEFAKRWMDGRGYRQHNRFAKAIKQFGWTAFESHVLALGGDRQSLHEAEERAIEVAGGHFNDCTFNDTPGGDIVAVNDKPIVGVFLPTGETREFASSSQAARELGLPHADMVAAVARGDRTSVQDWWFRYADETQALPPTVWGNAHRVSQVQARQGRPVIGIHYESREKRRFASTGKAARELGLEQTHVSQVATGKAQSAGGWFFHFEDEPREIPTLWGTALTREKRDRTVYAVNLLTQERREFRNCTVADTELGLHPNAASTVAAKTRASAGGWWFSYEPNGIPPDLYGFKLVAKARSKPIIVTNKLTGREVRYDSAKAAAAEIGIGATIISGIIHGSRSRRADFDFRFAEDVSKCSGLADSDA